MNTGILMRMTYEYAGLLRPWEELAALAETGHVTDAAALLGVAQPTLSRSLARTAADVGAPLVRRRGRGVELTRHGRELAAVADRVLAEVGATVRRIRAEVDPDAGLVHLGFQHVMGVDLVPRTLRRLHDTHPRIRVDLVQGGAHTLATAVAEGRLDLGLVALRDPVDRPGVTTHVLGEQELVLLVPPGHALADAGPVSVPALAGEALVAMAEGYGMRSITDRLLAEAGVVLESRYECRDLATASGLVAAGLGVTVAPKGVAGPGAVEVALRHEGRTPTRTVQLLWHEASLESAPTRALRGSIEAVVPPYLLPVGG